MAELDKNLETVEETVETLKKVNNLTQKQKRVTKPVKQGSSDAASIESGKGEVVKPEENPVDKAVASVKSAEKQKEVSGDANKKVRVNLMHNLN